MAKLSIAPEAASILGRLARPNEEVSAHWPGGRPGRQPIHTVYGGAQLFRHDIAHRLGVAALAALDEHGKDPFAFARAIGLTGSSRLPERAKALKGRIDPAALKAEAFEPWLALEVHRRVRDKLTTEPVEDFRIDFEDGFGHRPDEEEDAVALVAADQLARGLAEGTLPPFIGIRVKPLNEELKRRSARTLDLFVTHACEKAQGKLPPWFAVTLPKITAPAQVSALAHLLAQLERKLGLKDGAIQIELMIEQTPSLFDAEGRFMLPALAAAANGRCAGAHFGTYDYTASVDVTAAHQTMGHPACQLALSLMQVAFAGTRVALSDGATNVLPVPIHRVPKKKKQIAENTAAIHAAWALSYRNIRASLANGLYQGWDLHPAQIPVRYAATYAFFLEGFDEAAARLQNFVSRAAQAVLAGGVFDDAATGQGLLNFFLRARQSGAIGDDELGVTGLTADEIQTRSFSKILEGRTRR
ncbi:MAG: phosphoenolpyruvate kinase [Sandaracinaceae bacterium]